METETRQLVKDATHGDLQAVDELLERYRPGLERYVRRHAGNVVTAKESGSDLVQSVCREVLVRLGTDRFEYRGEGEFKQWLYQAALLKIRNRRRYYLADKRDAGREDALPADERRTREEALFGSLTTPSQAAMRAEQIGHVRAAYDQLPEAYRRVITMAHIEERPHAEVAAALDITEAHSRVLLSRALARLATLAAHAG